MIWRRRPGWSPDPDRALRIAMFVGAVLGILIGGLTAPFGIFPR